MNWDERVRTIVTTLAVSVAAGSLVWVGKYYLVDARPSLRLERLTEAHFPDASNPIDIFAFRISNDGNKEILQIKGQIGLRAGTIEKVTPQKSSGLIDLSQLKVDSHVQRFSVEMLNPGQYVTFNILAHTTNGSVLELEALGAGVDAHEAKPTARNDDSWVFWVGLASALAGIIAALVQMFQRDSLRLIASVGSLRATTERVANSANAETIRTQLENFLARDDLLLVHNPNNPRAIKPISFNADNTVGKGQNRHENAWRLHGDFLEIINDDGLLQNRFFFDSHGRQLKSTNDTDVAAIEKHNVLDQKIIVGLPFE